MNQAFNVRQAMEVRRWRCFLFHACGKDEKGSSCARPSANQGMFVYKPFQPAGAPLATGLLCMQAVSSNSYRHHPQAGQAVSGTTGKTRINQDMQLRKYPTAVLTSSMAHPGTNR